MAKPAESARGNKEVEIKAPLRYFSHVKVKKKDALETVLKEESLKHHFPKDGPYTAKIFGNRIEFAPGKNAKRPAIKKIKFSNVERIIPNEDDLSVYLGCRQRKNASVTSIEFTEEAAFDGLMNNLAKVRGLATDERNQMNQTREEEMAQVEVDSLPRVKPEEARPAPRTTTQPRTTASNPPDRRGYPDKCATSYIFWQDPDGVDNSDLMSTDLHMPASGNRDTSDTSDAFPEAQNVERDRPVREDAAFEEYHCPCCIQRSGFNFNMPRHGPRAYAPSSVDSHAVTRLPTHFPSDFRCYRPQNQRPRARITEDTYNVYDGSTLGTYSNSEVSLTYQTEPRHKSLNSPIYTRRTANRLEISDAKPRQQRYSRSRVPKGHHGYQRSWTVDSTSSGYTSATFHEGGLELTVDPNNAGHYIRNQSRIATGELRPRARTPEVYTYKKPQCTRPRNPPCR